MGYLESIADALLRWSDTHRQSRPLCVATARHLLLLAEAELKVFAMSKFAGNNIAVDSQKDLQTLIHALRHSDRSLDDISRSISSASAAEISPNIRRVIAAEAMDSLIHLATVADQVDDMQLADSIDMLLASVDAVKE